MATKSKSLVEEPEPETPAEEEETYSQYAFNNCVFNITMSPDSQVNIGTGKPAPFPPPK